MLLLPQHHSPLTAPPPGAPPAPQPPGRGRELASQWFNVNGTWTLHWTGWRQLGGWQPHGRTGRRKGAAPSGGTGAEPRPPPLAPASVLPCSPSRAELAPGAVPSQFQRILLLPKSHLLPSSASSSPENPGDTTGTLGNMLGRNRRAVTAGLRSKKGSNMLPQSDQALINQSALT